jgi:hypothetical protein
MNGVGRNERLVWMMGLVILVGIGTLSFLRAQSSELEAEEARAEAAYHQNRADSLRAVVAPTVAEHGEEPRHEGPVAGPHLIHPGELRDLQRQGLSNPISALVDDLRARPDLIGTEGVLGGTMGFRDPEGISILNDRWVFARYDDGHIMGAVLLRYAVDRGRITWQVVEEAGP